LILLLIFVVRTTASDCLGDRLRNNTCNVSSGTLNLTHSLTNSFPFPCTSLYSQYRWPATHLSDKTRDSNIIISRLFGGSWAIAQ